MRGSLCKKPGQQRDFYCRYSTVDLGSRSPSFLLFGYFPTNVDGEPEYLHVWNPQCPRTRREPTLTNPHFSSCSHDHCGAVGHSARSCTDVHCQLRETGVQVQGASYFMRVHILDRTTKAQYSRVPTASIITLILSSCPTDVNKEN
jgi:hypothetical protein